MVISAQWELVQGNVYAYMVLSAFGYFYGAYGAITTPFFGVKDSYGEDTAEYYNALGFFILSEHFTFPERFCTDNPSVDCLEFIFPSWVFTTVIHIPPMDP